MSEEYLTLCADVRAKLYGLTFDELKPVAAVYLPLLDVRKTTRAKTLSAFEELIAKSAKEADRGIATLTDLSEKVKLKPKEPEKDKEPVKGTYMFRKDFKISGQIDCKNGISFISYRRQVEDGQKKGYKDNEIIEGIIRAISTQNSLRSYLEGRPLLELNDVNSLIRSYYKEKTATELYQNLSNLVQDSKETPQDFVFRALDLRQKVLFASKEKGSGMSYGETLVQNMTLHAILTGLKDDNIRRGLEPTLLKKGVTDEELIMVLNTVTSRELERRTKIDRKPVKVNQIEVAEEQVKEKKPVKEGILNTQMNALKAEVDALRQELKMRSGGQAVKPLTAEQEKKKTVRRQCHWCEQSGKEGRCDHCFWCGSDEHFSRGCKQKKSQQQENSKGPR